MRLRTGSVLQPASTGMVDVTSSLDGSSFGNKYMMKTALCPGGRGECYGFCPQRVESLTIIHFHYKK